MSITSQQVCPPTIRINIWTQQIHSVQIYSPNVVMSSRFCHFSFVSFSYFFWLKQILSAVLDSTPYAFSIKLAVAASRIDHSHLEKWLIAKLRVCKDDFLQVICITMLLYHFILFIQVYVIPCVVLLNSVFICHL